MTVVWVGRAGTIRVVFSRTPRVDGDGGRLLPTRTVKRDENLIKINRQ